MLAAIVPGLLVTRGPRSSRRAAITFDASPSDATLRCLDACDRLGVRATFFLRGDDAAARPDVVRECVRRGHEVAGRGYSGTPFGELSPARLVDELARTADLLPPARTPRPLVRLPDARVTARTLARVFAAGYLAVGVTAGTPGAGAIVRFDADTSTTDALAGAAEALRAQRLELVTVSELLGA